MRVLVDVSYLSRPPSGSGVYIEQLVPALRTQGLDVVEAHQRVRMRMGGRNPLRTAANALLDTMWLHIGLPRAARAAGADVVHHPLPAHSRRIPVPQVVTVHDVAFIAMPERYGAVWRRYAERVYRRCIRRADVLVCVSEATAREAESLLGADRSRIVVAPHGPGQVPEGMLAEHRGGDYFLYVGGAEPRKNLSGLLDAYAEYREQAADPRPLVVAGRAAESIGERPGVQGRATPDRAELLELNRGALALVHPSLHEGFGLPLLEAMALGVPVVAVRNAGTEELCADDAALLVEPAGLAVALARVADDGDLRASLSSRGARRAGEFSWARSAADHARAYSLAAATERPSPPR